MANINPLNTYTGPDALRKYFHPDSAPPLPLVELPPYLNPYYDDGVRMYAKMMTAHPANNVKAMPAMKLLAPDEVPEGTKTVCEYSSGSTVISMSMVSRIYHGIRTQAFLSNKTSRAKLRLMQFFGLDLTLFGGPSQPEPTDERGGIRRAHDLSTQSESTINPNQYTNDANWKAHVAWTGPQILKQLPEINLICSGMGTSGTMTGLGTFFKEKKSSVYRLGVCTAPGDRVPGPRSYALLSPVEFPWRSAVDSIEDVGSIDSYSLSLNLCRNGIVCGPSSGFNMQGLLQFLGKRKSAGTLADLAGPDQLVHCVFMCCDLPYQYIEEYFEKLEPSSFPVIKNEALTKVDLHRYDEAWELPATAVLPAKSSTLILDFRNVVDFAAGHLTSAINIPLQSLTPSSASPFFAADLLAQQWTELESIFSKEMWRSQFEGKQVWCLCYNGDTARVASSVLRARGFEACSIKGGALQLARDESKLGLGLESRQSRSDSVVEETKAQALEEASVGEVKA